MTVCDKFNWAGLVFAILLPSFLNASKICSKEGKTGDFSKLARDLCFQDIDNQRRELEILSPDRSLVLVVSGQNAKVNAKGRGIVDSFTVARDEEIVWSPDSRALLFTISFGAAGPVTADFDLIQERRVTEGPPIAEEIKRDFASRHAEDKCYDDPNVAGLGWVDDSRRAVFVAEVPPSPQCEKSGGYFEGYVVSFPDGHIIQRYPMRDTILRWHTLFGRRLKDDVELLNEH